jgi:uncharacterized protein YpmS
MKCPNCGNEQEDTIECHKCGIIFAKYKSRQGRDAHEGQEGSESPSPPQAMEILDKRAASEKEQSLIPSDPFEEDRFDPYKPTPFEDSVGSCTVPQDYMSEGESAYKGYGAEAVGEKPAKRLSFFRLSQAALLICFAVVIVFILSKPSLPEYQRIGRALTLAAKAEKKIASLEQAFMNGIHARAVLTEHELNSLIGRALGVFNEDGAQKNSSTDIHLRITSKDMLILVFKPVFGRDIQISIRGTPFINEKGYFEFNANKALVGKLPVPETFINSALKWKLKHQDNNENLKAPPYIRNMRIDNGLLILENI